jgi:hypothetical protein
MRPRRWIATAAWLLWLYLAYVAATGWMRARPEKSLLGTWQGGSRIECRSDGSVSSNGATSSLVRWQGSRFVFNEARLTAAVQYPDPAAWHQALARQCGIIRMNLDLDGPHVNHRQVGDTIEATVRWDGKDHFELDGFSYTRVE